jgi:hypothetical protein
MHVVSLTGEQEERMRRDDLLGRLAEWLEQERLRYREGAHKAGIGSQVILRQCVASEIADTSVQFTHVNKAASPLAVRGTAWSLRDLAAECDSKVAALLQQTYGERCRHWAFVPQVRFEDTPERWIEACLLGPLRWRYLAQVRSLDDADDALARRLVEETIAFVEGETVDFVTALPVGGLRLDRDEIRVENVTVRPLTGEELGELANVSFDELQFRTGGGLGRHFDYYPERCLIIVRNTCRKTVQPESGRAPHCFLLALQLLGFQPCGRGWATTYTEPVALWSGGQGFRLPDNGETRDCHEEDIASATALGKLIPEEVFSGPRTRAHVSLHRFMLGAAEEQPADALIDYMIALEALLLPGQDELSFRLALFGAHYLGGTQEERRETFQRLKSAYALRSTLVHGAKAVKPEEIRKSRDDARDLSQRLLSKALREGWPTETQLRDLVV